VKIVVAGGSGLVGARLVNVLWAAGHEVVAPPARSGAYLLSARTLDALIRADVLVDVASPPSFAARAVLEFFAASSRNLVTAAALAGVEHHVVLSMVGVSRINTGGYFRAKAAQEDLIRASSTPYTIVRSTQSLEFIDRSMGLAANSGGVIRLPIALVQPIAADDLAEALALIVTSPPKNGTVEVAGPEQIYLHELARLMLSGHEDPRRVVASADARYFGALLGDRSLLPGHAPQVGSTTIREWLRQLITAG
jgi:uncharacterized protein YbjT (DUF2867 family)